MTRRIAAACTVLVWMAPAAAQAQPASPSRDHAEALKLFEEGRTDVSLRDYASACQKFEESQRLESGIGTLFNLADCYERLGRLASAWATFSDVAERAQSNKQPDRAAIARKRADALAPRVPHLQVAASLGPDETLTLDGASFAASRVGTPVPIDPGDHELVADAPGKKHWSSRFHAAEQVTEEVTVSSLEPSEPPPSDATAAQRDPIVPTPRPSGPESLPPLPQLAQHPATAAQSWHVPAAIAAAGLGVVALGIGTGFGIIAVNDWSSAQPGCSRSACSAQAYPSWQSAHTAGTVSTVAFAAGGALVAAGAVLWMTRPRGASTGVGLRADGTVVVGGALP